MSQFDLFSHSEEPAKIPAPVKQSRPGESLPVKMAAKKRGRKSLKELENDPDVVKQVGELALDKQYYSISEVAEMFRVNTSLIRFWENEFDILQPKKNRKGDRLFRPEDIQHLRLIYYLLRERKFTIEGARQKLKENKKLALKQFEMIQSLVSIRKFLLTLKESL